MCEGRKNEELEGEKRWRREEEEKWKRRRRSGEVDQKKDEVMGETAERVTAVQGPRCVWCTSCKCGAWWTRTTLSSSRSVPGQAQLSPLWPCHACLSIIWWTIGAARRQGEGALTNETRPRRSRCPLNSSTETRWGFTPDIGGALGHHLSHFCPGQAVSVSSTAIP